MMPFCVSLIYCLAITLATTNGFKFFPENREIIYEYVGNVKVESQTPWVENSFEKPPPPSGWRVRGTLKVQRIDENSLAAALAVEKVVVEKNDGNGEVFYQNKEMKEFYHPFKIVYDGDVISSISFKDNDLVWAKNFKRAVASVLQIQGYRTGAFVEKEPGIHGVCSNEYYISTKAKGHLSVRKTPELNTCTPHFGAIHSHRANVPEIACNKDHEKIVIVGYEAIYDLSPARTDDAAAGQSNDTNVTDYQYSLNEAQIGGSSLLQTFESTGESQYVISKLTLKLLSENEIVNAIDVTSNISASVSSLIIEEHGADYTGGRQPQDSSTLVRESIDLLVALADSLEDATSKLDEPYEARVAEIIRLIGRCNLVSLQSLYKEISMGTSYRQETVRNLFYDIIPRIGTKASVLLTRDLIEKMICKPTTAVQLLVTLPFHISELSGELVTECESLMSLGPERPDVKQAGILSFATIVYNSYVADKIPKHVFDKYVKKYFDLFLNGFDHEQKMLYLQGLRNLKLGKVVDYLDPIIRDETQNKDIRFLAAYATFAVSSTRAEKTYETFWPIFENRSAALELRVAAFTTLLFSNPTPARLISIHALMESETNSHLINFYRTTILSLAGTTHPCLQKFKRLTSYMIRHLPKAPPKRFWVTGNYLYDYRSNEYGIGALLQAFLIGDPQTDLPTIGVFRLDQEALGRYTGQLTIYIKARGLSDAVFNRPSGYTQSNDSLKVLRNLLSLMKLPKIPNTPLHLEVIVQFEEKSVLSFFMNQNTFQNLTDGDIINRITTLLQTDSHINLQNLRWPFFARYSVPTVLGTPSSLTVQRTVFSSLRGNITQSILNDAITRMHQIDVRHSTYAVVTSKSYNPFLNLEHSINREQGLVVYLPINNELSINLRRETLKFSFYRPNNLTSGISLKSRMRRITKGRILSKHDTPYQEIITTEGDPSLKPSKLINHEIKDVGLTVTGVSHPFDVVSHLRLLWNTEPTINTFVDQGDSEFDLILELWSILSVNEIHIGTNKKLELLFHNTKNTKLEGQIKVATDNFRAGQFEKKFSEKSLIRVDINLEHKTDDEVLHNLDAVLKYNDFHNTEKIKLTSFIKYFDTKKREWRLCTEGIYEPIVFLQKPYSLRANIVFGDIDEGQKGCPKNQSHLVLNAIANIAENVLAIYNNHNQKLSNEHICPRQVLKFQPPALTSNCRKNTFADLTTIHDYQLNISLQNSPKWLDDTLRRMDHLAAALTSHIKVFQFENHINISVNTQSDKLYLTGNVNGQSIQVPNVPMWLNQAIDAKFDTQAQYEVDIGFVRTCNVINHQLNTFNGHLINFTLNALKDDPILLVADCSAISHFALFISNTMADTFTLKLHVYDVFITYTPSTNGRDVLQINGKEDVEIVSEVRPSPENDDFRVYVNEEDLVIFEIDSRTEIQYLRGTVLSIKVAPTIVGKLCGICSSNDRHLLAIDNIVN